MSFTPAQKRIREMLREYPDGLTVLEITRQLNLNHTNTKNSLTVMPDVYIDRWVPKVDKGPGKWRAVYCAIVPPENCPKPFGEE
jgi:hypothetical protein